MQLAYGVPLPFAIDPVEKKPLNHFFPGTQILSHGHRRLQHGLFLLPELGHLQGQVRPGSLSRPLAEAGGRPCARASTHPTSPSPITSPRSGASTSSTSHAKRPTHGVNTVMVSNGYITREAFFDIYRHIDAANIDLKAFTEKFYSKVTLTHLQPVLDALKWLRHETSVWFEMTNLIIPTLNDDDSEFKQLCDWVLENLGDDVPLHFTAFHPDFKLQDKPRDASRDAPSRTPHGYADGPEVRV